MSNYKIKDIVVIVISAIIFVGALVFIFEGGNGSKDDKSKASSSEIINEPVYVSEYNDSVYKKIADYTDYSIANPSGLCKGDLFSSEGNLADGSICYALEQLGLNGTTANNSQGTSLSTESMTRNDKRKTIAENAKTALEKYFTDKKDYPASASNKQLSELLKTGGALQSFLPSGSETEDPAKENTRICYARRSSTQYWLYIVKEPSSAPKECSSDDPKDIVDVEDFSVR